MINSAGASPALRQLQNSSNGPIAKYAEEILSHMSQEMFPMNRNPDTYGNYSMNMNNSMYRNSMDNNNWGGPGNSDMGDMMSEDQTYMFD